jgi:hypothetical protein
MKTFINKTSLGLLAAICMVAVLASSCKKDDLPPVVTGDAKIKVVNAVSGSVDQDFFQGSTKLTTTAVAYGSASNYLTVKGGTRFTLAFKDATTGTTRASFDANLSPNVSYTAFYSTDASGAGQIIGLNDDNAAPATGKAKIRFMNIAYNTPLNIIVTGGSPIINNLQYGYVSAYNLIDANAAGLTVSAVGGTATSVIPGATFESGKVYTVWVDGSITTTITAHVITHN